MTHHPADSLPVAEFVELARSFCAQIGEHEGIPVAQFLQRVQLILPRLYGSALSLPSVGADAPDCDSSSKHTALCDSLMEHLGDWDMYREVFDPYDSAEEQPIVGSLADDISDIYAEISGALDCWDAGNREGAIWTWHHGLQFHWGKHLTSALRALHAISSGRNLTNGEVSP